MTQNLDVIEADVSARYDGRLDQAERIATWKGENPIPLLRAAHELLSIVTEKCSDGFVDSGEVSIWKSINDFASHLKVTDCYTTDALSFERYHPNAGDRLQLLNLFERWSKISALGWHTKKTNEWRLRWSEQFPPG